MNEADHKELRWMYSIGITQIGFTITTEPENLVFYLADRMEMMPLMHLGKIRALIGRLDLEWGRYLIRCDTSEVINLD